MEAGLQIMGGTSRQYEIGKHSLRLVFKSVFGPTKLEFPVFGPDGPERFDTIALRAVSHDGWSFDAVGANTIGRSVYLRDSFQRDTQAAMGQLASRGRWVHLFINGMYWGLYNPSERPDASFAAENLGGEPEHYESIRANNQVVIEAVDGDLEAWNQLLSVSDAAAADGDVDDAELERISQLVDIPALIDYILLFHYNGSRDGPVSGQGLELPRNWYAVRNTGAASEGFKFLWWDGEFTLEDPRVNRTGIVGVRNPARIFAQLSSNTEFRQQVADHIQRHFYYGGALTVEATTARFTEMVETIRLAMYAESARWGDHHAFQPSNHSLRTVEQAWQPEVDRLLRDWFPVRTQTVLDQLRVAGLRSSVDAPQLLVDGIAQHGGIVRRGAVISFKGSDGVPVYYTTDGSDPRAHGGSVSGTATRVDNSFVLDATATVKARAKLDGQWSGLLEATYVVNPAQPGDLVFSEVHYHPADPTGAERAAGFTDANEFEFVEFVNRSNTPIDLRGVQLVQVNNEGVAFDFATGEIQHLEPGGRVLVVENVAAFAVRYGNHLPVAGEWRGRLGNGQEQLTLVTSGSVSQQFAYVDDWFPETDGVGASLEVIDLTLADLDLWNDKSNWTPSIGDGGTPGREADLPGDANRDGVFDSEDLVAVFMAGEYEDGIPGNSTFEEGDWNGDGDFDSEDIVAAFRAGTYRTG